MSRCRKREDFVKTGEMPRGRAAETANDAITASRSIALGLADFANAVRQFRGREKKIRNAATELSRRSVIVARRVLDIGRCVRDKTNSNQRNEHGRSHEFNLNSFSASKATENF